MPKDDSIGALWIKEGKSGPYMSGVLEIGEDKIGIVVFKNSYKNTEKQPDYRILKSRPREEQPAPREEPVQQQEFKDDIPF